MPLPGHRSIGAGGLSAVAAERKRWAKAKPKLKRGRPASKDQEARRLARKSKAMQEKIRDLFEGRFLFVQRRLTPSERHRLLRIARGLPQRRKLARDHGTYLRVVRPALPDADRTEQVKKATPLGATVSVDWRHLKKGLLAASGKSPDVS